MMVNTVLPLILGLVLALIGVGGLAKALFLAFELREQSAQDTTTSQDKSKIFKAIFYFIGQFLFLGIGLFMAVLNEMSPLWLGLGLVFGTFVAVYFFSIKYAPKK